MKLAVLSVAVLAAGLLQSVQPGNAAETISTSTAPGTLVSGMSGSLTDIDGESIGTVTLTPIHEGVLIRADMDSLPPGVHGFHLHEVGECDPATGFASAGGHISGGHMHGFLHDGPTHPGDMPNIHVPESGSMIVEVVNERISLAQNEGEDNPLTDADGASLVIHSGADDYVSQPSGDAGDRIACAVLTAR